MATYASLTSLMHILEQIQNHPRLPITIDKQQIESLRENISFFQDFLENYSHEGGCIEAQGHLETQIADAAYAAEDVIESHIVDHILAGEKRSDDLFYQALQTVVEDIDAIKKEVIKIQEKIRGINDDQLPRNIMSMSANIIGSSTVPSPKRKNTNTMVGFDDVLIQIMERLTGHPPARQVLPIVGMGGIGKTTLARNVYDNPFIVQHFHIRVWITISQEYRLRDILLEAHFRVSKTYQNDANKSTVDELGDQLYKSLSGRSYLIILDDMWSIKAWEKLMRFFPDNNNGSRIMITTRLSNVAEYFGSSGFKMNFLDEDKSWDLFCKIAFPQDKRCPHELEDTGKKIAINCKGLPLSIVVIGGLLANSEKTLEKWDHVSENLNSIVNLENNEHCLKTLSLSYNHLPVHLKPCFLFMGVFPEDKKFRASRLTKLWVAEGLLKPVKAKSLEVVAKEYLKDLIDRNLILVISKWGSSRKVKFCNMHDLLRDMCLKEAQKENFPRVRSVRKHVILDGIHSQRHICIHQSKSEKEYDHLDQSFRVLPSASLTRSLICNAKGGLASVTNFRLLRVFKATGKYFLEDVLQLVNSRYLDFRANWNSNAMLFSSIRLLWNLQTLIIKYIGGNQFVVPLEIWELSQLRHLEIDWHVLPDPPNAPGDDGLILRNLQTLLGTTNFKLSEEVTKRIPNIKKLQLYYVDCPKGWARNYCVNNLGRLNQLKSLVCKFMLEENLNNRNEFRLNFSFPRSLKKLILFGTHLHWTDMKMIGELPLLEILKLKIGSFHGSEWNPVEGEFPCLKFLLIARCEDLVTWTANSTHFPCLEHLVLKHLILLKEVPSDIGEIPTLQSIKLSHCSVSAVISAKNIQQEQEKFGNVGLQIRVCCKEKTEILESLESDNFQVKILTR